MLKNGSVFENNAFFYSPFEWWEEHLNFTAACDNLSLEWINIIKMLVILFSLASELPGNFIRPIRGNLKRKTNHVHFRNGFPRSEWNTSKFTQIARDSCEIHWNLKESFESISIELSWIQWDLNCNYHSNWFAVSFVRKKTIRSHDQVSHFVYFSQFVKYFSAFIEPTNWRKKTSI